MSFSVLPPEVNSARMFAGPGAGPFWAAAQAWDGIGAELNSVASTFGSVTSDLAVEAWQGPASALMTHAAGPYAGWLSGAAAQAEESASQARAAAAAFEAARAAVVDPGLVTANRGRLVSLVLSNLFGQNAPTIAAAEAEYEQMWAHDVAVMSGYHINVSAAVAQLGQWGQTLENLPGLPGGFARAIGNGFAAIQQEMQQTPTTLASGLPPAVNTLIEDILGSTASVAPATQNPTFTGNASLLNRIQIAGLRVAKQFMFVSGIDNQLANPSSTLQQLIGRPLWPFTSTTPPKFFTHLFGETIQTTTIDGMSVVEITPANPSGQYVIALHGGVYFVPTTLLHWIDYTVMAHQTGATFIVPNYPLLQEGATAATVVPKIADVISTEVGLYGTPHVSLTGDSAGANLALAGTEYILANPGLYPTTPLPSSMVLLSPWLDLAMDNPNIAFVNEPIDPIPTGQVLAKIWATGLGLDNYEVSPLFGSQYFSQLPKTYVYSSSLDALAPDVVLMDQQAANLSLTNISFVLADGQFHDWIALLSPDAFKYFPQIEQELGI